MGVNNAEFSGALQRFREVEIRFQMRLPGHALGQQRFRVERHQFGRRDGITRREQRNIVAQGDQFLDEESDNCLDYAIILRGNTDPWRGDLGDLYPHIHACASCGTLPRGFDPLAIEAMPVFIDERPGAAEPAAPP